MARTRKSVQFATAADVARVMDEVAAIWKEQPLMTGVSLRAVIPFAEAMATLAKEVEQIKLRLPPEGNHRGNGSPRKRK
jgi:hypothetical protein